MRIELPYESAYCRSCGLPVAEIPGRRLLETCDCSFAAVPWVTCAEFIERDDLSEDLDDHEVVLSMYEAPMRLEELSDLDFECLWDETLERQMWNIDEPRDDELSVFLDELDEETDSFW